jgi:cyanophycin synthetase
MLQDALLANGVTPDQIDLIIDELAAVNHVLTMARPGDLLLIFADQVVRTWKQVINFRPEGTPAAEKPRENVVLSLPAVPEPQLSEYATLVRDERGVRLAREDDD